MTLPRSASTLPPPSTLRESAARAAWTWALVGWSSACAGPASDRERDLWRSLILLLMGLDFRVASSAERDTGERLLAELVPVAPWQRVACARSAWACASRAARRRGTWPRLLPLAGVSAWHRQPPGIALSLMQGLHGAELGAELYGAAVAASIARVESLGRRS